MPSSHEAPPSDEVLRDLHACMVRIRRFEEAVADLRALGTLPGIVHLSLGAEAVAAGVCGTLRPDDQITTSHRPLGHLLAKGVDPGGILDELLGRASGLCGGTGGSLHLTDLERGVLGAFGIVGAGIPVAVGAAFASRHQGTGRVAVAFFGDGATNIGAFHEAANLAAARRLPIVFVCENDDRSMATPRTRTMAIDDVVDRAAAYGMAGVVVDGTDVTAVHAAATLAVDQARRGDGPSLIEARIQRLPDPAVEAEGSLAQHDGSTRDPITQFEERLIASGLVDVTGLDEVHRDARQAMAEIVAHAVGTDDPPASISAGATQ